MWVGTQCNMSCCHHHFNFAVIGRCYLQLILACRASQCFWDRLKCHCFSSCKTCLPYWRGGQVPQTNKVFMHLLIILSVSASWMLVLPYLVCTHGETFLRYWLVYSTSPIFVSMAFRQYIFYLKSMFLLCYSFNLSVLVVKMQHEYYKSENLSIMTCLPIFKVTTFYCTHGFSFLFVGYFLIKWQIFLFTVSCQRA